MSHESTELKLSKEEMIKRFPEKDFSMGIKRSDITTVRPIGIDRGALVVIVGYKRKMFDGRKTAYRMAHDYRIMGPSKNTFKAAKAHAEYTFPAMEPLKKTAKKKRKKASKKRLGSVPSFEKSRSKSGKKRDDLFRKSKNAYVHKVDREWMLMVGGKQVGCYPTKREAQGLADTLNTMTLAQAMKEVGL